MSDKLRILVVDDEPRARSLIRKLVGADPSLELTGECGNGYDAVRSLQAGGIDLLLLDIQMPEMDGFEVLRALRGWELPLVIFVTAFDRYALRAFEEQALDYLLKPFDPERFRRAVQRAREHHQARRGGAQSRQIAELLALWKKTDTYLRYITVSGGAQMHFLPVREIDWIAADDNYIRLHAGGQSYLLRETLSRMAGKLDPTCFRRVHRSALINLSALARIEPQFHGEYLLVLKSGQKVTLSRSYRDAFFDSYGEGR